MQVLLPIAFFWRRSWSTPTTALCLVSILPLFLNNAYGKVYLNNHSRYKVSLGVQHGLFLVPDQGSGHVGGINAVVASTDILFKRLALRVSAGHLLFNDGILADPGSVAFFGFGDVHFQAAGKRR